MPRKTVIQRYMAALGRKGGKATGARKARSPEHYRRLADMKREASAKRRAHEPAARE